MSTEPKAKRPKWHYIAGAVGALVLCGVVGNMLPDTDTDAGEPGAVRTAAASPKTAEPPAATDAPKGGLTKEAFNKIEIGMSCDDLASILGSEGKLSSETAAGGMTFRMLEWSEGGFATMPKVVTIMCGNGKVDTKAQVGLN